MTPDGTSAVRVPGNKSVVEVLKSLQDYQTLLMALQVTHDAYCCRSLSRHSWSDLLSAVYVSHTVVSYTASAPDVHRPQLAAADVAYCRLLVLTSCLRRPLTPPTPVQFCQSSST